MRTDEEIVKHSDSGIGFTNECILEVLLDIRKKLYAKEINDGEKKDE